MSGVCDDCFDDDATDVQFVEVSFPDNPYIKHHRTHLCEQCRSTRAWNGYWVEAIDTARDGQEDTP